ncbi:MAG: TolC family protein [Paraprevotella sp.]|nr:TolC family protein [Paraprevotella sp.]
MKRLFGLLMLVVLCGVLHAQRLLTLDSCRNMALANNKSLLIAKEQMEKAHYDQKAAFTKFLPDFSATGSYMYFSDEISLLNDGQKSTFNQMGTSVQQGVTQTVTPVIQQIAQTNPQLAATLQQVLQGGGLNSIAAALNQLGQDLTHAFRTDTRNVWAGSVTLMQPLYMGGKIRAYNRITKNSEVLARTQYETQMQDILLNTDEAYWMAVSLSYKKKMAESYLSLVNRLDSDVENMILEGVATKADGLTVKVKVNEAEMLLTKVDDGLTLSKMLLCQLCGLDLNTQLTLADESRTDWNVITDNVDGNEAVTRALSRRPELESLDLAHKIYEDKVRVVRSEMLPSLALTGGYLVSNPALLNGFENKFRGLWNVGVMLSIPIFHWNEGLYKVKAAQSEVNMARLQQSEAQEKIELQVNQSLFKNTEAKKRLAMSRKNMEKAEENLNYADKGFKEGIIPVTNVMEAQTAWLSAHSDEIDAQIDVRLAQTYLQKALGTLGDQ